MQSAIPVFQPESPEALAMYRLLVNVLWISAGIFFIVAGLILVAIVRGRKTTGLPEQIYGNRRREIAWLVGPVLIVLWIAAISANLILSMNAVPQVHPARELPADAELRVVAHQWWWEVIYDHEPQLVGANEIHIPINTKIRVKLESADVVHCFWAPQLARKIDVIPGSQNYIWLESSRAGVYQGRCAEYCGNQHAWMNFKIYAHEPEEYRRWLTGLTAAPTSPADDDEAHAGQRVFFSQTCVNCHSIQGTAATGNVGPDLTHIASRQELGGGVLVNSTENLQRWLKNPQQFKPGCKMPNFHLTQQQARDVAAYLESLR